MSQLNWVGVRNGIAHVLKNVGSISIVHGYPRLLPDRQSVRWKALMTDRHGINAWTIRRERVAPEFGTSKQIFVTTTVMLVGLYKHDDARQSQDVFDETLDNVLETFFRNYHLDTVDPPIDIQGPAQFQLEELRLLGEDTPVHYAEVGLTVQQTIRVR